MPTAMPTAVLEIMVILIYKFHGALQKIHETLVAASAITKKKLRERRRAKKQAQKASSKIPDLRDHELVQKFFLQEVQLGEELLACGEIDGGVEHLANAVAVCGQPAQLLTVLQKTLPPPIFQILVQRLPSVGQKIVSQTQMAEEDVE